MDRALKQRLVGASVLIALAVIVLPMLLGGRPQGAMETHEIEVPPQPPELEFESRRFPVGEIADSSPQPDEPAPLPRPRPEAPAETTPDDSATTLAQDHSPEDVTDQSVVDITPLASPSEMDAGASETDTESMPEDSAVDPPAQPPDEPLPGQPASQPADMGRYVVQVASFGSAANANRLADQLTKAGLPVLLDNIRSDSGVLNRVRLGPYSSAGDASAMAERVQAMVEGVAPRVIELAPAVGPSESGGPSSEASVDPLARWVVQVGSFSSAANADKLVERLKGDGLPAYSEVLTRGDSTIHRVRVGPYIERATAEAVRDGVVESIGPGAVVMGTD